MGGFKTHEGCPDPLVVLVLKSLLPEIPTRSLSVNIFSLKSFCPFKTKSFDRWILSSYEKV